MVYHRAPAIYISRFLQDFKVYAEDPAYQRIEDYFNKMPRAEPGMPAPDFTLVDKDGKQVSLASFKGKHVLLDFWFHNCVFCRQMAPSLVKIYADLRARGFEIVSISVDSKEDEKGWRKAMEEDRASWTELWDYNKTLPGLYGVNAYPTMFLLDGNGKVLSRLIGNQGERQLRNVLAIYIN